MGNNDEIMQMIDTKIRNKALKTENTEQKNKYLFTDPDKYLYEITTN